MNIVSEYNENQGSNRLNNSNNPQGTLQEFKYNGDVETSPEKEEHQGKTYDIKLWL